MNILVTGGAGYIGSILVPMLLAKDHRVRVLDTLLHGGRSLLGVWSSPGFELRRGDIRDRNETRAALGGIDAVVHLAAIVGDPACARHPELARSVNLEASQLLFEESKRADVSRLVVASTCSNYGKMKDPNRYVDETTELSPVSLYAETKVSMEQTILALARTDGLCATSLRFATVFGVSPRMRFDLMVNEFTMELLTKRRLVVYGEQFWRPYIHVRDVARAIETVLGAPSEKVRGEVFNVGDTQQNYQKGQLVKLICDQVKNDEIKVEYVHKEEDPRDYRVSFEKIKRALGFGTTCTVEDGVREIIRLVEQGVITDFDNPIYRN